MERMTAMEIKLEKRVKYAGDIHTELMNAGFTPKSAAELLNRVPDADVAPVTHGKWERKAEWADLVTGSCSACGQTLTTKQGEKMNYCPRCGAKMDLEEGKK